MINRRGLLVGMGSALAAPAIVHAGSIMPVKIMLALPPPWTVLVYRNGHEDEDPIAFTLNSLSSSWAYVGTESIYRYSVLRHGNNVGGGWMQNGWLHGMKVDPAGDLRVIAQNSEGTFRADACDNWLQHWREIIEQ